MKIINKIILKILPRHYIAALKSIKILEFEYGHFNSAKKWKCENKNGEPIPWYTYPAIEYLSQLDFREKTVFEWGSGYSSLYWAVRAKFVLSIEDNKEWYQKNKALKKNNQKTSFIQDKYKYINSISNGSGKYNVIVIDGSNRYQCSQIAPTYLKTGGIIILDNSDWFPKSAKFLREANLIQIDFKGFGPINGYTWATSIFFHREFNISSLFENQPSQVIGSTKHYEIED